MLPHAQELVNDRVTRFTVWHSCQDLVMFLWLLRDQRFCVQNCPHLLMILSLHRLTYPLMTSTSVITTHAAPGSVLGQGHHLYNKPPPLIPFSSFTHSFHRHLRLFRDLKWHSVLSLPPSLPRSLTPALITRPPSYFLIYKWIEDPDCTHRVRGKGEDKEERERHVNTWNRNMPEPKKPGTTINLL